MAIVTNQLITQLYTKYRSIEVTFNQEVSKSTGLQPRKVFLKFKEGHRPCILYSSSLEGARVLVSLPNAILQNLKDNETIVSLRLSFLKEEAPKPVELNFFVQARLTNHSKYEKDHGDLYFCTLSFTSRPPDDLIEILGFLLEANVNATKRKEDRILITVDSIKKLNLGSKNCVLEIDGIPRKAILRDLSFSGAKVIILGNARFLINKNITVRLLTAKHEYITIPGKILRFEEVQGRRDLAAIALHFSLNDLPLAYKVMINNYLLDK